MIILMGIAGSGKSIQGQMLAQELGCEWLSVGSILRKHTDDEQLRQKMLHGHMLDDSLVVTLIEPYLERAQRAQVVLDGFPRTTFQADWLIAEVGKQRWHVDAIIHIVLSEQEARARLSKRGRQDDHDEAIAERFAEYQETIQPIIQHMQNAGLRVHSVDGDRTIEEIHTEIHEITKDLYGKS